MISLDPFQAGRDSGKPGWCTRRDQSDEKQCDTTWIHPNGCGRFCRTLLAGRGPGANGAGGRCGQAGYARRYTGTPGRLARVARLARVMGACHHQGAAQRPLVSRLGRARGGIRGRLRQAARRRALPGHGQRHHLVDGRTARHGRGRGRRGDHVPLHVHRYLQCDPQRQGPTRFRRHRPRHAHHGPSDRSRAASRIGPV